MNGLGRSASALAIFVFLSFGTAFASAPGAEDGDLQPSPAPSSSGSLAATDDVSTGAPAQPTTSPTPSASPDPSASPSSPPSPTPSASPTEPEPQPSGSPEPTPSASPSPGAPPGDGSKGDPSVDVAIRSSGLLTQVGNPIDYVVSVTNSGGKPAKDLVVLDVVPPEVEVVGVERNDAVTATQIGQSPSGSDIVWVLDLKAGESLDLRWSGVVVSPGDLIASNEVKARIEGKTVARATGRSFLADADAVGTKNPPVPTVKRKVVTLVEVPVAPEASAETRGVVSAAAPTPAPAGPAGSLPATGADLSPLYVAGLLIAAGLALLWMGRRGPSMSKARGLTILLFLFATACVSTSTPGSDEPRPEANGSIASPDAAEEAEPEVEDQVLGERIRRGGKPDDSDTEQPGETGPEIASPEVVNPLLPDPVAPEPLPEPATELVREVEIITVPQELPVTELGDTAGTNGLSFVWSEENGVETAASSTIVDRSATVSLSTQLQDTRERIRIVAQITNLAPDSKLHVDGRVLLDISSSEGSTTLSSEAIDVVLNPDGSTSVAFDFLLPSGDYSVSANFKES